MSIQCHIDYLREKKHIKILTCSKILTFFFKQFDEDFNQDHKEDNNLNFLKVEDCTVSR